MARFASAVLVAFTLAACIPPDGTTSVPPTGSGATVEFVADGDTFETTDGTTFRLDGINAPETDECFFAEARDGLREMIDRSAVEVTPTGTDQFGRTLVQVYTGGVWVNLSMVTEGLALATTPEEGETDDLVEAERRAFAERTGLWAVDACGADAPVPAVAFDPDAGEVDPPGPDEDALSSETVVIVNRGDREIDLSGWTIRDESSRHRFTFRNGTRIGAGERITIASTDSGWSPGSSPVWNNGGDLALLIDPDGRIVDRYRY